LRQDSQAVSLVREMVDEGKPVLALCHAPWMLVEADVVRGRRVTSYPSLRTDLVNAGADWVDGELVSDNGIFTSRNPDDLPACSEALLGGARGAERPRREGTLWGDAPSRAPRTPYGRFLTGPIRAPTGGTPADAPRRFICPDFGTSPPPRSSGPGATRPPASTMTSCSTGRRTSPRGSAAARSRKPRRSARPAPSSKPVDSSPWTKGSCTACGAD